MAYDKSGSLKRLLQRPQLTGAIGKVAHELFRLSGGRQISQEAFDAQWDASVDSIKASLDTPSSGHVPPHDTWPNYWMTYERLRMRLVDETLAEGAAVLSSPRRTLAEIAVPSELRLPLVERTLRDDVRHIVGTPDLVYTNDQGETCIRDYKSGANPSPSKESAQLHLYAHLVGEMGLEPVWGEVDRLRGTPEKQLLEPVLVEQVVARAMEARVAIVSHSAEGTTLETCAQCPYLHICPESSVSEPDRSTSACGTVIEIVRSEHGDVAALSVETGGSLVVVGGLDGRGLDVEPGDRILATGLRNNSSATGLLAEWSSVLVTEEGVLHAIRSGGG